MSAIKERSSAEASGLACCPVGHESMSPRSQNQPVRHTQTGATRVFHRAVALNLSMGRLQRDGFWGQLRVADAGG